jgi:hypothetical protein
MGRIGTETNTKKIDFLQKAETVWAAIGCYAEGTSPLAHANGNSLGVRYPHVGDVLGRDGDACPPLVAGEPVQHTHRITIPREVAALGSSDVGEPFSASGDDAIFPFAPTPVVVSRGESGGQFRGIRGPGGARRNRGAMGARAEGDPRNGWKSGSGVIKLDGRRANRR